MEPLPAVMLVLGGARSGKSRYAESLIETSGLAAVYLATGAPGDAEMAERIREHQARRGARWRTVEEPLDLAGALTRLADERTALLVDCLTLWLANILLAGRDAEAEGAGLAAALRRLGGPVVLISNEVGLGIVPDNALARRFRDAAGRLHQRVAEIADRVVLMVAGLPHTLKAPPPRGR